MAVSVIVLGNLGDLVKKIVELELLEREPSKDVVVQMAAYYGILEKWPVEDHSKVQLLIASFKVQCAKLIALEASIEEQLKSRPKTLSNNNIFSWQHTIIQTVELHIVVKNKLKQYLQELNSQGQHLGLPPLSIELGIEEQNEPSADVGSEVNANS